MRTDEKAGAAAADTAVDPRTAEPFGEPVPLSGPGEVAAAARAAAEAAPPWTGPGGRSGPACCAPPGRRWRRGAPRSPRSPTGRRRWAPTGWAPS
ncbi:hypothetical protein ACFQXA_07135 [Nocardiopsis composta]